jgi:microsomal epoxide hydrolase
VILPELNDLVNLWITGPPKGWTPESVTDLLEKDGLKQVEKFYQTGAAYMGEHATRPATVGLALSSSRLALLAWCVLHSLKHTADSNILLY